MPGESRSVSKLRASECGWGAKLDTSTLNCRTFSSAAFPGLSTVHPGSSAKMKTRWVWACAYVFLFTLFRSFVLIVRAAAQRGKGSLSAPPYIFGFIFLNGSCSPTPLPPRHATRTGVGSWQWTWRWCAQKSGACVPTTKMKQILGSSSGFLPRFAAVASRRSGCGGGVCVMEGRPAERRGGHGGRIVEHHPAPLTGSPPTLLLARFSIPFGCACPAHILPKHRPTSSPSPPPLLT